MEQEEESFTKQMLLSIQEQLKQTNNKLDNMDLNLQEIKQDNKTLKSDLRICNRKYDRLLKENESLTDRLNQCEKKIDFITYKERSKNLILYKVPDTTKENNNLFNTVKAIIRKINSDIPEDCITDVKRLGKQEGSRPILITFSNTNSKTLIFQNRKAILDMNLSIANDLTREERERRRKNYETLLQYREILSKNGENAIIRGSKIILKDEIMEVEEVKKLLSTLENSTQEKETSSTSQKRRFLSLSGFYCQWHEETTRKTKRIKNSQNKKAKNYKT